MTLYNKKFTLNETAVDTNAIDYIPCEGTIIPLNIDAVDGLREQLYQCGFSNKKRVIKSVHLHIGDVDDGQNFACLCIKYANGKFKVIPHVGFHLGQHDMDAINADLILAGKQGIKYYA